MAKQIITRLVDDLDGGDAEESITFAFDGTEYEIDLSEKNAAKLRKALAPFVTNGTRVSAARKKRTVAAVPFEETPEGRAVIRAWARKSKKFPDLGVRGRIPAEVVAAWRTANHPR